MTRDELIELIKRYGYGCGALACAETEDRYAEAERQADALLSQIREALREFGGFAR